MIPHENISPIVNDAIDLAVKRERYVLNLYSYLKSESVKRNEVLLFLQSPLVSCMMDEITQLETYLSGEPTARDLKEVYGWMTDQRVRKFKDYLVKMIDDAKQYEQERKPGRKKRPKVTNK